MTELLEQAITEIRKLPAEEQDAIASRILVELADEQEWTSRFKFDHRPAMGPAV